MKTCPECEGVDPIFRRSYALERTPSGRWICVVCGREFEGREEQVTMSDETPATAEAEPKVDEKADAKAAKAAKKKVADGTHVLHEDGSLIELDDEFVASGVKNPDGSLKRQRQVKAKHGGRLYHHVGEVGEDWTYREEP